MPRSGDCAANAALSSGLPRADNESVKREPFTTWEKLCGGAAIATLVAAFLPWTTVLGGGVAGVKGDGQISVFCAIIGLSALTAHRGVGPLVLGPRLTLGIHSAAAAFVALVGIANVSTAAAIGLYVTILAGLAWIAGCVIGWRSNATPPEPEIWFG